MNKRHTISAVVFIAVVAAVLFAMPVGAQDTTHVVNLPVLGDSFRTWFTEAELNAERMAAGYDPAVVAVHTSCVLHPASTPENLRYYRCSQYYVNGQPTTNAVVLYWYWRGEMWHLTMSSIGGE